MPQESELAIVDLMTMLVKAFVDQPEQVFIKVIDDGDRTILRLRVASSDVGKVIGIEGRIANSLRILLSALTKKQQLRFTLEIIGSRGILGRARIDGWLERGPSPEANTLAP